MSRINRLVSRNARRPSPGYLGPWENRESSGSANDTRKFRFSLGDGYTSSRGGIVLFSPTRVLGVSVNLYRSLGIPSNNLYHALEIGLFLHPYSGYPSTTPAARVTTAVPAPSRAAIREAIMLDDPLEVDPDDRIHVDVINAWLASTNSALESAVETENSGSEEILLKGTIALLIEH